MNELLTAALPFINFFSGGAVACVAAYLRCHWRGAPANRTKEDALVCGLATLALTWLLHEHYTEHFIYTDSIPVGALVGILGRGKVLELLTRKAETLAGVKHNEETPPED